MESLDEALRNPPQIEDTDVLTVLLVGDDTKEFELRLTSSITNGHPSSEARKKFTDRFPQRKKVDPQFDTRWIVPATDIAALIIDRLWPEAQLQIDGDADVVYRALLLRMRAQLKQMQRTARYHEYAETRRDAMKTRRSETSSGTPPDQLTPLPPWPEWLPKVHMAGDLELDVHQAVAFQNALASDGYGFFLEPGTGKTACGIAVVDSQSTAEGRRKLFKTLVVAPRNVCDNWCREFENFSKVNGRCVVLRGSDETRIEKLVGGLKAFPGQKYITFVVSYEGLWGMWDYLSKIPWDLAMLDEGHFIKWPKTKRAQYAFKLRDSAAQRLILTGTPVCNTPIDLFSLFEFMCEGGSGFSTFEAFKNFYGVFTIDKDGKKRLDSVQNLPFLRDRLARMSVIVTKEEALPDLPRKTYDFRTVDMSEPQQRYYDDMREKLFLEIKDDLDQSEKSMTAQNILVKLLRLAQITSGFISFDPISDAETGETIAPRVIERIDPNPKIEALLGVIRGDDEDEPHPTDEKGIIWAVFLQDIRTISARLTLEKIDHVVFTGATSDEDRIEACRRFNEDPSCRWFLGNPAAGGVGLNLLGYPPHGTLNDGTPATPEQMATDCTLEVFFSQGWSSSIRSQAEDRPYRRGTRKSVRCLDLIVMDTIDQEIRERVIDKRRMSADVSDVRATLRRILGKDL